MVSARERFRVSDRHGSRESWQLSQYCDEDSTAVFGYGWFLDEVAIVVHSGAIVLVVMGCGGSWVGEGDGNGARYWVVVLLSWCQLYVMNSWFVTGNGLFLATACPVLQKFCSIWP